MQPNNDVIMAFFFEDLMKSVSSGMPEATIFRWRQNAKALGVLHLAMIDVTTYQIGQYYNNPDAEIIFERFKSLEEVEKKYTDHKMVIFETPNTLSEKGIKYEYLPKFVHPKKVIYVVGPDSEPVDLTQNSKKRQFVVIPADFKNAIWAETAMAIALYDRYLKNTWQ